MILSPNLSISKGVVASAAIISKARSLYTTSAGSLEGSGVSSKMQSHVIGGYVVRTSVYRNPVYGYIYGNSTVSYLKLVNTLSDMEGIFMTISTEETTTEEISDGIVFSTEGLKGYPYASLPLYSEVFSGSIDPYEEEVICTNIGISDAGKYFKYTGFVRYDQWVRNVREPSASKTGAYLYYDNMKFNAIGTTIFDAKIIDNVLYMLSGNAGNILLTLADQFSTPRKVNLTAFPLKNATSLPSLNDTYPYTLFDATLEVDGAINLSTGESYTLPQATLPSGGVNDTHSDQFICAKLKPDCTEFSLLYQTMHPSSSGNQADLLDITIGLSKTTEGVITTTSVTNVSYLNEMTRIRYTQTTSGSRNYSVEGSFKVGFGYDLDTYEKYWINFKGDNRSFQATLSALITSPALLEVGFYKDDEFLCPGRGYVNLSGSVFFESYLYLTYPIYYNIEKMTSLSFNQISESATYDTSFIYTKNGASTKVIKQGGLLPSTEPPEESVVPEGVFYINLVPFYEDINTSQGICVDLSDGAVASTSCLNGMQRFSYPPSTIAWTTITATGDVVVFDDLLLKNGKTQALINNESLFSGISFTKGYG